MKNSKKATSIVKVEDVVIEEPTAVNNTVVISDKGLELLKSVALASKGVSVDVIRHTAQFVNKVMGENNVCSIALLRDNDKAWLKKHCFDYYLQYDKPSYQDLYYIKILGIKGNKNYNLKEVVDKFETFLTNAFQFAGIIDEENNILMPEAYKEWYSKCRLYLHEDAFANEIKIGKLDVFNEFKMRAKSNPTIDLLKEKLPVTNTTVHQQLSTDMIQEKYEDALHLKFVDNLFDYTVA